MDITTIAPELRTATRLMGKPPVRNSVGRALVRGALAVLPAKPVDGVTKEVVEVGHSKARVYTPPKVGGSALLWVHGGGMLIGSPSQDEPRASEWARDLDMVVVAPTYRLAPESKYPDALDDLLGVWHWMLATAEDQGVDVTRIAIGGQSAGGGLAAALVQRIHDLGGVQPIAQWLFCPMLDDRTSTDSSIGLTANFLWDRRMNNAGWSGYLGVPAGSESVPDYAVPARRTNLDGLPAAWVGAGTVELFYVEDVAYAERLTAAGVDTTFVSVEGAPHAFESWAGKTPLAQDYMARALEWLKERVAG